MATAFQTGEPVWFTGRDLFSRGQRPFSIPTIRVAVTARRPAPGRGVKQQLGQGRDQRRARPPAGLGHDLEGRWAVS
jgi:hypothetical protein